MTASLIATVNAADAEIVETVGEFQFTRAELRTAFDRVANKSNWKLPVDSVVVFTTGPRERIALHVAIRFFTGSSATMEVVKLAEGSSTYRVRAAGYYAAVGA
jgi:hypothetical protein